jgi:Ferritin-like domain
VVSLEDRASRRALLRGAGTTLAVSAFGVLAGCGRSSAGRASVKQVPLAVRQADVRIFNRSLYLERRAIAAYVAGIPLLNASEATVATQFLNQELAHAGELLGLIHAAGGKAIPRAPSYDLGHPRNAQEVFTLLHGLEGNQIAAYLDAIPRLSPGPVRAAVASILANDAQHVSILRLELGSSPAPAPFVTGRE